MAIASIWWVRRDLRLSDNLALQVALDGSERLIPLFILDPNLLQKPAQARMSFMFAGLRQLDDDLKKLGSHLVVRSGDSQEALRQVMQESGAVRIVAAEDYSPYAMWRDKRVFEEFPLTLQPGVSVRHPASVVKANGSPYTVFTSFSKAWKALTLQGEGPSMGTLPAPAFLPSPGELSSDPLPEGYAPAHFPAGESEAQRRLRCFCDGPIFSYADDRNRLDLHGTSALSPYLRFGMLSPRQALSAALAAWQAVSDAQDRSGVDVWIDELIWRDFYMAVLYYYPHVLKTAFNPSLRDIPWREAPEDLDAWKAGLTGYPVVDAAMRQLAETGWMHNRGRMIVASFLVKDLLLDWRDGERWFMRSLVDGDPAANNGGWQWTAGVGTDAAPYFRIFNPMLQGNKFDPSGAYVRRWVPELENVPDKWIHAPWGLPQDARRKSGFTPGKDYPHPIVEHAYARRRTQAAYHRSKE